ncbi:MFS transporter [Catellatospora sp. KI3]|uniref:MFS transporter n=1 Tax=Catellatospora sp. KI3 TaxID=3041620 RepID=UPI002482ED61|nr:MFS transporter [Catellatospora sp. KI3]MDI1461044.1 MFS transporter [Catellatospora sp. KI3]
MTADTTTAPNAASPWWTSRFGHVSSTGWRLLTGLGLSRLGFVVVPFAAYWLASDRNLNPAQVTLVMTAFGAGWMLGVPTGGTMADRIGRKPTIITANTLSAGAFLLLGAAPTLVWLGVAAVAAGLTFDLARPAVQALLTDTTDPQTRPKILALLYWIMNLSRAVSCIIGGLLADKDFRLLFVLNAVLNLAFAAMVAVGVTDTTAPVPRRGHAPWRQVLSDRPMAAFTGVTLVFLVVHTQSTVTLPIVMDQAGIPPTWYGVILAADPIAVVIAQLLLQRLLATLPAPKVCAAGIAAIGIGLPITALGNTVTWFIATTPLWVAGEVMFLSVAPGIVAGLASPQLRGAYFGTWGATLGAAALAGPALAAVLLNLGGSALLWAVCATVAAAAALACLRLNPSPASDYVEERQ